MKRIPLVIALILIVVAAFAAFAQRGPMPNGPGGVPGFGIPGGNNNALAEYLGLTSDQKNAWESIQSELRANLDTFREQERSLEEQLHTALDGGSTDAAALGNLLIQIRAIQTQIKAAQDTADAKFVASLTADQKVKFAAFQAASEFLRGRGPGGPRG